MTKAARITALDKERFTEGDCHILARALAQRTGWKIAAITATEWLQRPCFHAFCVAPNNWAIDVEGMHDIGRLVGNYGGDSWSYFTYEEIKDYWQQEKPLFGPYSYGRAHQVAELLVERLSPKHRASLRPTEAAPRGWVALP